VEQSSSLNKITIEVVSLHEKYRAELQEIKENCSSLSQSFCKIKGAKKKRFVTLSN
jgi:hypothetical protein